RAGWRMAGIHGQRREGRSFRSRFPRRRQKLQGPIPSGDRWQERHGADDSAEYRRVAEVADRHRRECFHLRRRSRIPPGDGPQRDIRLGGRFQLLCDYAVGVTSIREFFRFLPKKNLSKVKFPIFTRRLVWLWFPARSWRSRSRVTQLHGLAA